MNETIKKFLNRLDIDVEKFDSMQAARIKSGADINSVISKFHLYQCGDTMTVSIGDIVGYDYWDYGFGNLNIISNLSDFFDENGDAYHRRSVSMLEIPEEELFAQLNASFVREPICLKEVEKDVYNISQNGLHRYNVLRVHYLNELSKLNLQDENAKKALDEKYSLQAYVVKLDFVKTYSAFLLNLMDDDIVAENHYDEDWNLTEKVCLSSYSAPERKLILSNTELIDYVNIQMNNFLKNASREEIDRFDKQACEAYDKFESFRQYCDKNLNSLTEREM